MINLKSNERLFICGHTGSGKSYLLTRIVKGYKRVIFIDPKHEHSLNGSVLVYDVKGCVNAMKNEQFFVHYKPVEFDSEIINELCKHVYELGNCLVVFDEVSRFAYPRVTEYHDRLIRMGRSRGIGVWHTSQRPSFVDNYVISESEHVISFSLSIEADRDKLRGVMGDEAEKTRTLERYHWLYYSIHEGKAKVCKPIA